MSIGIRIHPPRRFPAAVRRPAPPRPAAPRPVGATPLRTTRRRSRYDRWIGPIVIVVVLAFCGVMGLAGLQLLHQALANR